MVYIFLSAFLISQIFPREKIVLLRLYSLTEEDRNKGLKILEELSGTLGKIQDESSLMDDKVSLHFQLLEI